MDLATVFSVAQTIITAIETLEQLKATFSFSHCKYEFERLQKKVNTIQSVLEDADANQGALSRQQRNYIQELKDALYKADDVLDEFVTLIKQKQGIEASDNVSDKVRSFLSRFSLRVHNLSSKVKDINNKLDDIASNSSKFMFRVDNKPIKFVKQDTSSFVSVDDPIIGRGEDLEKIVKMLLGSDDVHQPNNNVSSLAIVGMGGLGKTAFAQLIYNDPRITNAFQLKIWACIADHDDWNLTYLLGKIVDHIHDLTTLERMHHKVREQLEGKKYLLVLDDVWTECYNEWQELAKYLMVGERGCHIIVTTRSKKTAQIVGGARVHELQGLSEDQSWSLFERMALRPEQRDHSDTDFIRLGLDIVKKCFNVPLAIRVVASLLHGESKPKWISFRDKELGDISESDGSMNKILSLSYHQLDSSVKSCFAYCAIFPKDFKIDKQMLIRLWMAQGYINAEYVGEEYISLLLQRCFFHDVNEENNTGKIKSFKIHDLLHDIAEQVAGNEICRLNSNLINMDKKGRHLYLKGNFYPQGALNKHHIRTCIQFIEDSRFNLVSQEPISSRHLLAYKSIVNWRALRSLDLRCLGVESLPESIGNLFHLRYLNLSRFHNLKVLPSSITKLVNLQTLILLKCVSLEKLPKDVCKLVEISTLDVTGCGMLSHMPSKLDSLTKLHTLGLFVVGGASSSEQRSFSGLEALLNLNNLKASLKININVGKNAKYVKEDHGGGAYLMGKVHLHEICIRFTSRAYESIEWEQALIEEMQPHGFIGVLVLDGYSGETMPRWPRREDNSTSFYFPNLVTFEITGCKQLRFLPSLEKLPRLKKLTLVGLPNVEYVVNVNLEECSLSDGTTLFPCLEEISIHDLPKLKGWWPRFEEQNEQLIGEPFSSFGHLSQLVIFHCSMLKSIPICSCLNWVWVDDSERSINLRNMDQFPSYKSLLPSQSKSRIISISYLESLLARQIGNGTK